MAQTAVAVSYRFRVGPSVGDFWWTANPITRIVFTPSIGSFDAGTSLALYAEA